MGDRRKLVRSGFVSGKGGQLGKHIYKGVNGGQYVSLLYHSHMQLLPLLLATLVSAEHFTVTLLDQTHSALSKHAESNKWNAKKLGFSKHLAVALVDHIDHDINYLYGETKKFSIAGGNSLANYLDVSSGSTGENEPILIVVNSHETPEFDDEAIYHARTLRESVTPEMRGQKLASVVREIMGIASRSARDLEKRNAPAGGGFCNHPNCPVFCPGCLIEDLGEGHETEENVETDESPDQE